MNPIRPAFVFLLALLLGAGGLLSCDAAGDDDDDADGDDAMDDDAADDDDADDSGDDDTGDSDEALLDAFQPLLVQKLADDYSTLAYPPESDLIGRLSLHPGDADFDYLVQVDTAAPVMYRFPASAAIRGREYRQLVYAFFYPERPIPHTRAEDPIGWLKRWYEAGKIDGKVVRVTLDADDATPLLIEVMQSCGCGWQLYVNRTVDDAARAEFEAAGQPYPGLVRADAPHDVQYVWVLPADVSGASLRPVVVDEDGWSISAHHILGAFTSFDQYRASGPAIAKGVLYLPDGLDVALGDPGPLEERRFAREPYDPLYRLTIEGSDIEVGIFDEFGYIWNSYSPLYKALRGTGMTEFPGTPRDVAAFEVVHETKPFWEQQALFEAFIYLPVSLFGAPAR
jgi:hypothetical protein